MKRYLYEKDGARRRLLPGRYEFLFYRQLRNGLESGDILCHDSVRFRSINDDLLDQQLWRNDKEALIAKAGSDILRRPIREHLADLKERLEPRLSEVNRRIAAGENTYFKLKENGRWTLEYQAMRKRRIIHSSTNCRRRISTVFCVSLIASAGSWMHSPTALDATPSNY
jgi:hypothetical protein